IKIYSSITVLYKENALYLVRTEHSFFIPHYESFEGLGTFLKVPTQGAGRQPCEGGSPATALQAYAASDMERRLSFSQRR
ncbi:MAG: hypothetical protein IKD18_04560, partial [Clostridia bacterium]|nr:hypothetical protein [Clostridia bacterium]